METHWKKLTNPDYIGAYDFKKGEIRKVKIIKVAQEKVTGSDGKKADCIVAQLENSKPLVLCKTNCKHISKIVGTPIIEEWSGKVINLKVENVKAFGEWVEALRVTTDEPQKEKLTPTHSKWEAAKNAIENGKTTIEAIKKSYDLSPENEALLCQNLK